MGKRDKEIPYEVVIQERKRVDLYGNVVYYIYWFDKYGYNITNEWKFWSKGPKKKYDRVNRYLTDSWLKEYCGNNNLKRDYNRCFKDESLDKDLFMGKYGKVMGEHYYNKFVHEFNGNILKMIGYFRGSEKEGQVFCDMITERIEKYEKRMSYDKGKLNN